MHDVFYLAWRYLTHHRLKTTVLVAAVTVIVALPVGLRVVVTRSAAHLTERAASTPLLIGAKGSPLELVLNSLYFESDTPPPMRYAEAARVTNSGLATAIPLYTRFHAQQIPIVGTSPEYFEMRGLRVEVGRPLAVLGECVLGARAARKMGVGPGGFVVSSPESVFDIAGVYPLRMRVVGVLAESGGPDDGVLFVDLKTAWVIEGLAHGHEDLSRPEAVSGVLRREADKIVANASVRQFNEITPENIDSFHFHGDTSTFPVTSIIAVPDDQKGADLLRGRYLGEEELVQIVRPLGIMEELLATILTVQRYVTAAVVGIGAATLATMALVFVLSLQLRRREFETMIKIGGSRSRVLAIAATEIVGVLVTGVMLAAVVSATMWKWGDSAMRLILFR
jgi:putative ABC transport system permease protein